MVTGGAGYIGSHMVLQLLDSGFEPVVLDNLSRGHADAVGGVPLIRADLRCQDDVDSCLAERDFDLVMHFAALAYVGESVNEPEGYYQNNVVGTLNLLAAMRRHGVGKIVFSSTCAIYGNPTRVPIDETHSHEPINPYGSSKLVAERALADYAKAYGIASVSLRYFNAAGCDPDGRAGERHEPETHLIPLILREAMRTKLGNDPSTSQLQVFGVDFPTRDGSCVRDFIHVSDICQAHLLAGERLLRQRASGSEAFNLANGVGFSVLEVIEACRRVTGQPICYQLMNRRPGDPAELVGDAGRARSVLGWHPKLTRLEEIIRTAWEWFQRHSN